MPRPVDSARRGAQVNVLKKVRTSKGWQLCPIVRESNGRLRDRVRVGGRIEIHTEGVYYLEWREEGRRQRGNRQQQQIAQMAFIGTNERPGAREQAEDVARGQARRRRESEFRRRYERLSSGDLGRFAQGPVCVAGAPATARMFCSRTPLETHAILFSDEARP